MQRTARIFSFNFAQRLALFALAAGWMAGCSPPSTGGDAEAGHLPWLTDLPRALTQARTEKKLVFLDFTGSDWCPPCKALHKTVLTSDEFEAYAQTNLVLVVVDFPHHLPQTAELKQANEALSAKFGVEGFPTCIVLDADGKLLSKTVGYDGEKPAEFIAKLQSLK
jgi:thiol:disulfide interchange protein